jgi:long-chain fatty acid transport protein
MKHITTALGALALSTSLAQAGGVERAATNIGFMFEKGNYAELSFGSVTPSVSGTQMVTASDFSTTGAKSGKMANSYTSASLALKTQLNDKLSFGILLDQPIGADVSYAPATGYIYGGLTGSDAKITSSAVTALLRYKVSDNVSIYGGPKFEAAKGTVRLFNGYTLTTSTENDSGYVAGVAYEKPEIALRVALTYTSAITHTFAATENGAASLPFASEVPQSLALDFQSGVAKDTLVFGSIRWREWSKFDITPVGFKAATGGGLVDYTDNVVSYSIGLGRRFNETWSGAMTLGHEKSLGGFAGNLGPTDGYTSVGLGGTYTKDNMKITGGVTYAWIGDARTQAPSPFPTGTTLGEFKNNHLVGVGVKVGFSF